MPSRCCRLRDLLPGPFGALLGCLLDFLVWVLGYSGCSLLFRAHTLPAAGAAVVFAFEDVFPRIRYVAVPSVGDIHLIPGLDCSRRR